MNKNVFLGGLVLIAMASSFASCSSDDMEGFDSNRLTLTSQVMSTRSINQDLQATQIANGVRLGVFAVQNEEATATGDNNTLTADGNGGFSYATTMTWPSEGSVSIYAYAPYNSEYTLSSACNFSVAADQSTDAGYLASDLIYGTPTATNPISKTQDGNVAMSFAHKLSKINIGFINNDATVDLKGATVSILGTLPATSFSMTEGTVAAASGAVTSIKAAVFASDATEFKASAIIVPQTIAAETPFVQIETADGKTLVAKLGVEVAFTGGKNYTYTVNIGEAAVETTLILNDASIGEWTQDDTKLDGKTEEVVSYGVGDYILADGTLVKNAKLTTEQQNDVAAVIFSTTVSTTDAAAGYVGYAVSTKGRRQNLVWRTPAESEISVPLLRESAVTTLDGAFSDLDGLTVTGKAQNKEASDGGTYSAFDFSGYSNNLTGTNLSGWFMPSSGQMIQLMNNLGEASIDASNIELNGNGEYTSGKVLSGIIAKINNYGSEIIPTTGAPVFATTTESKTDKMWVLTFNTADGTWKISKNAGKSVTGRSVLPIVAYKLPTE